MAVKQHTVWITTNKLAREIAKEVKDDYDSVIAFTGREGVGKTTHSIQLGKKVSKLLKVKFTLEDNIVYMPKLDDIRQKFNEMDRYQTIILDEAIKVLYKLKWMDKLQQELNEHYATERKQNKITILNIPRFLDLNEFFRNHRVRWWIHHLFRDKETGMGFGIVYRYLDNEFSKNPWNIQEGELLSKEARRGKSIKDINASIESELKWRMRHPNFYAFITWDALTEKEMLKYRELCDAAKAQYREWEEEQDVDEETKKMKERERKIKDIISDIFRKEKMGLIKNFKNVNKEYIMGSYGVSRDMAGMVKARLNEELILRGM